MSTVHMQETNDAETALKQKQQGITLTGRNTTGPPCSVTVEL